MDKIAAEDGSHRRPSPRIFSPGTDVMTDNKTRPTSLDPDAVIAGLDNEQRRRDARTLDALMRKLAGADPVMSGEAMFGYGSYRYAYPSGHGGSCFRTGFAVRSRELTVYVMAGFEGMDDELGRLGPHGAGKSCLYLKKLDAIDMDALERILSRSLAVMAERYPDERGPVMAARRNLR